MNPGTYAGAATGAFGGSITRYIQTPIILSSRTVAVPEGVKRIEALLVGGGGGGGYFTGGGFGGAAIIQVPVTGSSLQVVIGAGGTGTTGNGNDGSPTYIVSANTRYAEVGGGGGGGNSTTTPAPSGRSGGGGGGGYGDGSGTVVGGPGGGPPIGNLLWTAYPQSGSSSYVLAGVAGVFGQSTSNGGTGGIGVAAPQCRGLHGSLGGGGGGSAGNAASGHGGGAGRNGWRRKLYLCRWFFSISQYLGIHGVCGRNLYRCWRWRRWWRHVCCWQ
jgi:hypothetical protein